jgi:virginiamycin B lyase
MGGERRAWLARLAGPAVRRAAGQPLLIFGLCLLVWLASACANEAAPAAGQATSQPQLLMRQGATPAVVEQGTFREYPLQGGADGMLMRPVVDGEGRVWVGVMGRNRLVRFDPRNGSWQALAIPRGQGGMMGMAVVPDGSVWFAEQYANYIGHYLPESGQFRIYPLPVISMADRSAPGGHRDLPVAPNDLALDGAGRVWFTEMNADAIGRLDPASGAVQQYPLSAAHSLQRLNPYGIAVDGEGAIWFTESSQPRIGRLDPRTGRIETFATPDAQALPMEIAVDAQGMVWVTTFGRNLLLRFAVRQRQFTTYYAPTEDGASGGLYGLSIAPDGAVWVTVAAANAVARLEPSGPRFVYYLIPTRESLPFGVTAAGDHEIWFTEAGTAQLGLLRPDEGA